MDNEIGTFGNASNSGSPDCIRKHYTNNAYQRMESGPFDRALFLSVRLVLLLLQPLCFFSTVSFRVDALSI